MPENSINENMKSEKNQGDLFVREFKMLLREEIERNINPLVEQFVHSLAGKIDLDGFEPFTSFSILRPRKSISSITEEFCNEIKEQYTVLMLQWIDETLMPNLWNSAASATKRMKGSSEKFLQDLWKTESDTSLIRNFKASSIMMVRAEWLVELPAIINARFVAMLPAIGAAPLDGIKQPNPSIRIKKIVHECIKSSDNKIAMINGIQNNISQLVDKIYVTLEASINYDIAKREKIERSYQDDGHRCEDTIHYTKPDFLLLVIGGFVSGKTSLANALLGEKLLPTKAIPSTGLLTELRFGEKNKVILYPYPGKWQGGEEPFEVDSRDIMKYCRIDMNSAANEKDSHITGPSFQKMVVFSPLPLLKEGIVIVDSPGLDYPYSYDEIIQECLPKTDAVLYCMNGMRPYSCLDKRNLETLSLFGLKRALLIAITFYDTIRDSAEDYEMDDYINCNTQICLQYTDLGKEAIFFVDSLQGLKAKRESNHAKLVDSGYYGLERFIKSLVDAKRS